MKFLVLTLGVVFAITFLASPTMGAGWFWDSGNAIGFAAFGGLIYLTITSAKRVDIRAHQVFGYGVLFLTTTHILWFLLGDAAVVEFIKIGAPDYMWLGVASFVLLCLLMTIAIVPDRIRIDKNYNRFRYWHQVLAVSTIATATYHIVVSDFYSDRWYQGLLITCVAIAAAFGRPYWVNLKDLRLMSNASYLFVSAIFCVVFVCIRNIPA